ncbi:MAG: hypothetical protein L0323_15195 [Planctomycetes bacterium]|nr:hypothetical protein [Planctomycetota bacterium]
MDQVPPVCSYDTPGAPNAAAIETGPLYWPSWPTVPLTTALTFDFRNEIGADASGLFADRIYVEVDVGQNPGSCGSDWRVLSTLFLSSGTSCPGPPPFTVTVVGHPYVDMMAGSSRPLRFRFDTVDSVDNGHTGVYLDNLQILTSYCTPCLGLEPPLGYCVPRIESAGGTPRIGNPNYTLVLSGAPQTASGAVLILGISGSTWPGGPLPWAIPGTQTVFGSCLLCVSADVLLPVVISTAGPCGTSASIVLAIPNNSALTGAEAFAQWLVLDPGQAGGVLTSDAAGVVIQP